jgi:hypothetical protein
LVTNGNTLNGKEEGEDGQALIDVRSHENLTETEKYCNKNGNFLIFPLS